jgi:hypothetical protein
VSRRGLAAALALGVAAASAAGAHTRSTSYSTWEITPDGARVTLRIPQLELTRLPWGIVTPPELDPDLASYLGQKLRLEVDGRPCPVSVPPRALSAPRDRALVEWRVRCPPGRERAIVSELLLEVAPSHLHFAKIGHAAAHERLLTPAAPRWVLPSAGAPSQEIEGSGLSAYLWLGIEHIATGYDHLVFLLGLLLLASRLREVVTIVTGFTLAHSITLALAALGRVRPEAAAIEALIGLSIALVALENGWLLAGRPRALARAPVLGLAGFAVLAAFGLGAIPPLTYVGLALFAGCYFALVAQSERPARLRAAIAFCFGLVHGFGFAGVLAEFALPRDRLVSALLGFNLGVELGQLAVVAAAFAIAALLRPRVRAAALASWRDLANAGVCALGVFWWLSRAYG